MDYFNFKRLIQPPNLLHMNESASPIPSELLTLKSLKTLSGASITVWIVCLVLNSLLPENTLQYWHYRILAFILSVLITFTIIHYKKNSQKLAYWLLILGNTCYIFINASGINSISKNQLFSKSSPPVIDTSKKKGAFYIQKRNIPLMGGFFSFFRQTDWWPDKEIIRENTALKNELISLKDSNTGGFPEKDSLLKKISILEEQVGRLTDGSSLNEKTLTEENANLAAQVKTLTAGLNREKSKNEQLINQINNLKADVANLTNSLNACNQKYRDCLNKNDQLVKEGAAKPDNTSLTNQINGLKGDIAKLTNSLNSCTQKYNDCLAKNDQLTKDCAGKPDNTYFTNQINGLKGDVAKLTNSLNYEKAKTNELTKSLTACEQRYNDCTSSKDDKGMLEKYKSCLASYQRVERALQLARDSVNRCCTQKIKTIPVKKTN